MLAVLACYGEDRAQSRTGREIPAPGDVDLLLAAVKERPDDSERRRRLAFQLMRERRYDEALSERVHRVKYELVHTGNVSRSLNLRNNCVELPHLGRFQDSTCKSSSQETLEYIAFICC